MSREVLGRFGMNMVGHLTSGTHRYERDTDAAATKDDDRIRSVVVETADLVAVADRLRRYRGYDNTADFIYQCTVPEEPTIAITAVVRRYRPQEGEIALRQWP